MIFSASKVEPAGDVAAVAAALAGGPVCALTPAGRGGNNRVHRVETEGGVYALKVYLDGANDVRDRLGAEWAALEFLRAHGVDNVPGAVALDRDAGAALHQWIEGVPVPAPGVDEIDTAISFVARLRELAQTEAAGKISEASEACLSGGELAAQIERRVERLRKVGETHLSAFLDSELKPLFDEISVWSRRGYGQIGWRFGDDIELAVRTLSPSDFGFHNAIKRADGNIFFVDFEYFGWDDPVRLVSDFLLHPGMDLDLEAKKRFAAGVTPVYEDDWGFRRRLDLLFPLVALRWCLIILNEFLPEHWTRRRLAGASGDPTEACARQLEKARSRLVDIRDTYRCFPYGP